MLDGSGVQVHNANQRACQKLFLHTGCSTECHGQLGNSWGGQTLQILVSLGAKEGGKASLAKNRNLIVQDYEKTSFGQKLKADIACTKNTPMGQISWT